MAKNIGTLITSPIRPNDSLDPIPTALSNEIRGGHHGYPTLSNRDSLIEARRAWGMLVSVYNDGSNNGTYRLEYNYVDTDINNNSNWVPFSGGVTTGTTWLNSVISKKTDPVASPSDGDRYLIGTTASGDWFTHENKVTQYNNTLSEWVFTTPDDGYSLVVNDESSSIYRYQGTYSSGSWTKQVFGGIDVKNLITNETIEIPSNHQYFIYGNLTIDTGGTLINNGEIVTLNGSVATQSGGVFINNGTVITPTLQISKFVSSFIISPGQTITLTHGLNSTDLIVNFFELIVTNFLPIQLDFVITGLNTIEFSIPIGAVTPPINGKIIIIT